MTLEHVAIGAAQQIKIEKAVIPVTSLDLFDEIKHLDEVMLQTVEMDASAGAWLLDWTKPQANARLQIRQIKATDVKLGQSLIDLPNFDAVVTLHDKGLDKAVLNNDKLSVELSVAEDGIRAKVSARDWTPPVGPPFVFNTLTATLVIKDEQAVINELSGKLDSGTLTGKATFKWGQGLNVDAGLQLEGADVAALLAVFTRDFSATGALNINGQMKLQAATLDQLFASPQFAGTFTLKDGEIKNLDIVRAIQSSSRDGLRGGKTQFTEITGEMQTAGNRMSYRNLQLNSGPMSASGAFDISPTSVLSGSINVRVGSQTVTVARGALKISGSPLDPLLSP
jgi:hypothetical protein